jgi:hypothetical protein
MKWYFKPYAHNLYQRIAVFASAFGSEYFDILIEAIENFLEEPTEEDKESVRLAFEHPGLYDWSGNEPESSNSSSSRYGNSGPVC